MLADRLVRGPMHLFPVATNLSLGALRAVNACSLGYSARFLPLAPGKVASGRLVGVDSSGRNTGRL